MVEIEDAEKFGSKYLPALSVDTYFFNEASCRQSIHAAAEFVSHSRQYVQHDEQLRDFVQAVTRHAVPRPGDAGIVGDLENWTGDFVLRKKIGLHVIGIDHFGAKSSSDEWHAILSNPIARLRRY
jgi:hypothetical protein